VAPSSVGGNSSPLNDSQGVDDLATLDRYLHFHGHSGLCPWFVFPSTIGLLEFSIYLLAFRHWQTATTAALVRHQGHARGEVEFFF